MEEPIIKMEKITKSYNGECILQDVDFEIWKGQSVAITGANGTGKSTLLKIALGLVRLDSGKIIYGGKPNLCYIPEQFSKTNLTVKEYLTHIREIKNGEKDIEDLLSDFYMLQMQNTPMKHLSKGSLQKTAVIQAILTKPAVLFMDEPLSGQDMKSQKKFIEIVRGLNKDGTAVMMSCHEKFLIQKLSDSIFEIKDKKLEPVEKSDSFYALYDILRFEKSNAEFLPAETEILEQSENEIILRMPAEKSNEIITEMISKGFLLREMSNEYI